MANPELIIKISGNTKEFEKSLDGISGKANKFLTPTKVAAAGAAVSFAALSAGAAASVQEFKNFEREFSNVVTLLDKSSFKTKEFSQGVDDLKSGIVDLSAKSGQSFDTLNKGLFDLVSAGVDAEGAIEALRVATDLALAGSTDASIAVDGLTSAMNAYGLEASEAQAVAEKFFTAQKFGKTTIAELSADLGKVAATAASMGVSFDEVLSSVSAVTLAGIETNEAYTGLKAVFSNIIKPSKDAADEAKRLGIEFNSSALKAQGLSGFLDSITSSANFNSTSLEKLFGSMEAVNIALSLTGNQADDFKRILTQLNDEQQRAGTFTDALATKNDTLDQKYAILQSSAAALRAEIGERLSPAFGEFAVVAAKSLDNIRISLNALEESVRNFPNALGALGVNQAQRISRLLGSELNVPEANYQEYDVERSLKELKDYQDKRAKIMADFQDKQKQEFLRIQAEEAAAEEASLQRKEDLEQKKAEIEEAARVSKAESDAEFRERQLELEDERFEEDLERLNERLQGFDEVERDFAGLRQLRELDELKKKARTAQQKEAIDKQVAEASKKFSDAALKNSISNLQILVGEESAVGKAIFLIRKAQAVADTIVNTQKAMALARATVPPPAGDALAARYAILGALNVAVISATAIQGVKGAAEGGIVQGGSFGRDTQPFLLAKDEIIVPSRLNPLSPNFDETFGGGLGGQNVQVMIGFDDQASRILTVKQREDSALGIQR